MGEIVSGVATTLLEKLAAKAYQEIASACGLKGDVEKLRASMRFISAYLMDAENKQVNDLSITEWLQQLKEAFDDASDIMDEIECEALRNQLMKEHGSMVRKVRRFFSSSNAFAFLIKMSRKIRDIRARIEEIATLRGSFGLVVIDHSHDNDQSLIQTLPWRETHSKLPSRITGRYQEKEKVINDLIRPNLKANKIDVIPIVGIGGLGKTTLAQLAYNDERVIENFPLRMWVCVSDEFEMKKLMLKVLKAAGSTERDAQSASLDQVRNLLHEALHEKKFLLVLDDVWNEDSKKWQELEDVFLGLVDEEKKNDSKIIVTTRSNRVASIMGNVPQHNLGVLPKKMCLELFFKCAFSKGEEGKYPRLKEIGKEIVEKCKGVPLAVVTLGCLLKSQYDEDEWKKIRDSELWELEQHGEDDILPALKLSYNKLPLKVKQCLLLCSIFPKDYEFYTLAMITLWMAHGLLQPSSDKENPEYVGELYIKMLLGISFFVPTFTLDNPFEASGSVCFKIHDLVHDLIMSMTRTVQAIVTNDCKLLDEKVQYLSFLDNVPPLLDHRLKKVRTIMSRDRRNDGIVEFVNWICNQFKHLWVLDFEESDIEFLPDCLDKMKHLRFLNLWKCSRIEKLPSSICKLQNLKYLSLPRCKSFEGLPRNMSRYLVSLQGLFISAEITNFWPMDIGSFKCLQTILIYDCPNLVSLPRDLGNLTSLKKLYVAECPKLVAFEDDEDGKARKKTQVVNNFGLQVLAIAELPKLTALPNWLARYAIKSLHTLFIRACGNLSSLRADINQFDSLQHLYIIDCDPELEAKYREASQKTELSHVHIHFGDSDSEEGEEEDEA